MRRSARRSAGCCTAASPRRWRRLHADDLDPVSGQIASHYERAGMAEQAIPHYQRAAVVAQRVYANEDAIALLSRGLALLEQLPPGAKRDAQELDLQLALAPLYRMTKGWTSPEVERVLDRAMALCDTVGDDAQRAQMLYGLQSLYVVQARLEKVQLVSDELHSSTSGRTARPRHCCRDDAGRRAPAPRPARRGER